MRPWPIDVIVMQRGLMYWHLEGARGETTDAPSPGRIDGQWGPRTHEALRAYIAHLAPPNFDAARVLAPLRNTPARATRVEIEGHFASLLRTQAIIYEVTLQEEQATGRPRIPRPRTPRPQTPRPSESDQATSAGPTEPVEPPTSTPAPDISVELPRIDLTPVTRTVGLSVIALGVAAVGLAGAGVWYVSTRKD